LKYLSQCDYIYSVKNGRIIECGRFDELMASEGHLASLVKEHVIIESKTYEKDISDVAAKEIKGDIQLNPKYLSDDDIGLTIGQLENRRRVSSILHINDTNESLAKGIERNQLRMTIDPILKKNFDLITAELDPEEPVPEDADPMKLVLEDQSINYRKNALVAYMQAGSGVFISISIVVLFFLVHGVRIGSGK